MDSIDGSLLFTTACGFVIAQAVNHAAFKLVETHYGSSPNASAHAAVVYAIVIIIFVIFVVAGVKIATKRYNKLTGKKPEPPTVKKTPFIGGIVRL